MKKFIRKIFIDDTDDGFIQFIRYFIVGGIAAVVNIGLLFLLVDIFSINYIHFCSNTQFYYSFQSMAFLK